jgi:hypothetical protein
MIPGGWNMDKEINIWSPVIVAHLPTERTYQHEIRYLLKPHIKSIEDIKIRVRNPQVDLQGKFVEARVKLDIIAMTEDTSGRADLLRHQEMVSERIPLRDFEPVLEGDGAIDYLLQINSLRWEADYHEDVLLIKCNFQYEILALREQVVKLLTAVSDTEESIGEEANLLTEQERLEMERVHNENIVLIRKLHLNELDLKSLQRAVRKAEGRNLLLNRQLKEAREAVARLNDAITRKDLQICRYESYGRLAGNPTSLPPPSALPISELNLGQRLKKMFISNL